MDMERIMKTLRNLALFICVTLFLGPQASWAQNSSPTSEFLPPEVGKPRSTEGGGTRKIPHPGERMHRMAPRPSPQKAGRPSIRPGGTQKEKPAVKPKKPQSKRNKGPSVQPGPAPSKAFPDGGTPSKQPAGTAGPGEFRQPDGAN